MSGFHLAQFNVATLKAPLESPEVAGFRDAIDRINALAEGQPGFLWRGDGEGFSSDQPAEGEDPLYLVNMSVWESAEHLAAFVYRTDHRTFVRDRLEWFLDHGEASFCLWWIPAGTIPRREEGVARLAHFQANGPSAYAFDFKTRIPAPDLLETAP